jgi:hypothetical protein
VFVRGAGGFSRDELPKERPPEPQAAVLAQTIRAPVDRARAVQDTVDEAAAERDAQTSQQSH